MKGQILKINIFDSYLIFPALLVTVAKNLNNFFN